MCALAMLPQLLLSVLSGHTETIFGAAFDPVCSNTLATCSYDATVKVWHTPTMDLKVSTTSICNTVFFDCVHTAAIALSVVAECRDMW
jgi:WD40 repeat protein